MPSIATVLRQEIVRLSRAQARHEVDATRKATAQHRRDIAALKRQVTQLERQVKRLSKRTAAVASVPASDSTQAKVRFVAKGLRSQRNRLGLSAGDFGKLIGVSGQSIYNWERGSARPRNEQLAKLASLRGLGKREAGTRLKQDAGAKKSPRRS